MKSRTRLLRNWQAWSRGLDLRSNILPFRFDRERIEKIQARFETRVAREQEGAEDPLQWAKYQALSIEDIRDSHKADLARREGIIRRAQAYLGTVAVMSAFMIGTMGLLRQPPRVISVWLIASGMLATLVYLAGAAWFALRIAKPDRLYDLFLQNRVPEGKPLAEDELKEFLIRAIHMNQAMLLIYAVYSERSYRCIRNGIVGLVGVLTLLLLDLVVGNLTGES